jgi:sugar phosphate permease
VKDKKNNNKDIKNEQEEKEKEKEKEKNKKNIIEDKTTLNLSISNLTVSILYPIVIRWTESYNELNSKKDSKVYGEEPKTEKKNENIKSYPI